MTRLAEALKKKRTDLNMSIGIAADQIGLCYAGWLSEIEEGHEPSPSQYAKCCNWLGVDPAEYLEDYR